MKVEVLPDRQFGVERERLRHIADPVARTQIARREGLSKQQRLAFARWQEAGEHFHGRRFAAAIRTKKPEDFSAFDCEAHAVDRREVAETASEIVRGDDRRAVEDAGRRYLEPPVAPALGLGHQRDEPFFERRRAGARLELGRRSAGQHLARVHRRQPVEPLCLFHVSSGDHHAHALPARPDAVDQLPELPARQRIDAGRRLVENEKIRIMDEAAAKAELLPHAARQLFRQPIGKWRKARAVEQLGDFLIPFGRRLSEQAAEKLDVLADREIGIEVPAQPLRHEGDAGADQEPVRAVRHVAVENEGFSRLNPPGAGDDAQKRRFSYSVGADQSRHAGGRDFNIDVVKRDRRAVALRDPLDPGDRRSARDHGGTLLCSAGGHATAGSCFT